MERDFKRQKSEISAQSAKLLLLEGAVEKLEESQKDSVSTRAHLELELLHQAAMAGKATELAKLQLEIAKLSQAQASSSGRSFELGDNSAFFFTTESEQALEPKGAENFATLVKLRKAIRTHSGRYSLKRIQAMFSTDIRRDIELKLDHMRGQGRLPEFLEDFDEKLEGVPKWLVPESGRPVESIIERYLLVNYRDNDGMLLSQKMAKDLSDDTVVHFLQERLSKKLVNLQVSLDNGPKAHGLIVITMDRLKCEPSEAVFNHELKKYVRVPAVLSETVQRVERDNSKLFLKRMEEIHEGDTGKDGLSRWVKSIVTDEKALISAEGWSTLRDTVRMFFEAHAQKAKSCIIAREEDPKYQEDSAVRPKKETTPFAPGHPKPNPRKRNNKGQRTEFGAEASNYGPQGGFDSSGGGGGGGGGAAAVVVTDNRPTCWYCGVKGECSLVGADQNLICQWSAPYGNHVDSPGVGVGFKGSPVEAALRARHFSHLTFGWRANGIRWEMPQSSVDGQKKYLQERKAQRALANPGAQSAPPSQQHSSGEISLDKVFHSIEHCETCCKLQDTLRDTVYSARANMFLSPSKAIAERTLGTPGLEAAAVGAGGAEASVEDAPFKEEALVGEEREISVLLDTGASGRNFISSKLASWLIERGSPSFCLDGEVGLAQQGTSLLFHQHVSFVVRFFNLSLNVYEILSLHASVIEDLRIDVILGLPTVGKHSLLPKLTPQLCGNCTPHSGAAQGLECAGHGVRHRTAFLNTSNCPNGSLPGSLTTEIDQSACVQAPSVPQPERGCAVSRL